MTYRVALLTFTSAALLAGPLGGFAQAGDRLSLIAQTPGFAEPSTEPAEEGTLNPDESETANPTPSLPSAEVRTLQQQLGRLGYYQGSVDGVFGPATGEAISLFQRDVGLATTGLPDPLTLQQLQAAENPLGIVPETPAGESDALVSETADAVPNGQTDSASTPVDGGTEVTEPAEASTSPSEAENAPADGGGLVRLMLVGMVVAAMGISAAVAFLFLFRRPATSRGSNPDGATDVGMVNEPTAASVTAVTPQDQQPIAAASPVVPMPSAAAPTQPTSTPIADAPRNGHHPPQETPPQPTAVQSSALAPETTTKLVPVNIIDELVQDLQNPDPAQRRKAIWELGQRGNSAAVQPLVRLMLDADSKERSLILAALAEINTQTLKPMNRALALSLQDENPEVRKNAIRDMTRIYDLMGQASTMLNHAATDSDPEVRQTASWAIEQLDRMRLKAINTDMSSLPGHNGSEV